MVRSPLPHASLHQPGWRVTVRPEKSPSHPDWEVTFHVWVYTSHVEWWGVFLHMWVTSQGRKPSPYVSLYQSEWGVRSCSTWNTSLGHMSCETFQSGWDDWLVYCAPINSRTMKFYCSILVTLNCNKYLINANYTTLSIGLQWPVLKMAIISVFPSWQVFGHLISHKRGIFHKESGLYVAFTQGYIFFHLSDPKTWKDVRENRKTWKEIKEKLLFVQKFLDFENILK